MKICTVEAELFDEHGRIDRDRQTYVMKLIVAFRNFANAPSSFYSSADPNYYKKLVPTTQRTNTKTDRLVLFMEMKGLLYEPRGKREYKSSEVP